MIAKSVSSRRLSCLPARDPRRAPPGRIPAAVLSLCLLLAACGPSNCDEAISIVQAAYGRLAEGDVDGFLGYFSEEAVLQQSNGKLVDREAARADFMDGVARETRYELSNLACEGTVVTSNVEVFFRDTSLAKYSNGVDVVVDGQIIFDGIEPVLQSECDRDPSQVFCP